MDRKPRKRMRPVAKARVLDKRGARPWPKTRMPMHEMIVLMDLQKGVPDRRVALPLHRLIPGTRQRWNIRRLPGPPLAVRGSLARFSNGNRCLDHATAVVGSIRLLQVWSKWDIARCLAAGPQFHPSCVVQTENAPCRTGRGRSRERNRRYQNRKSAELRDVTPFR